MNDNKDLAQGMQASIDKLQESQIQLSQLKWQTAMQFAPAVQNVISSLAESVSRYVSLAEREVELSHDLRKHVANLQALVHMHEINAEVANKSIDAMAAQLPNLIQVFASLPETDSEVLLRGRIQIVEVLTSLIANITSITMRLLQK